VKLLTYCDPSKKCGFDGIAIGSRLRLLERRHKTTMNKAENRELNAGASVYPGVERLFGRSHEPV
jgi:hypothetical protein